MIDAVRHQPILNLRYKRADFPLRHRRRAPRPPARPSHPLSTESPMSPALVLPVLLLLVSNVFMTFAWYGHLKFTDRPLWIVILASWGIAFFEYCLAVPANRIGHAVYSTAELKTMQEVITLVVFAGFSVLYLREPFTLNHLVGFAFICVGAFFVFKGPL
jgi:uncharacterized protein (DUF486 family)